ncbi:MAG: xanthine dehydrogenase family protein subunit M [bacterium]|nr:xanthine dehydrogenase family protein subunit M [bacterium]
MTATSTYQAPGTLEEATALVAETGATLLAGGTDLGPRWSKGIVERPQAVVDLKRVEELRGVHHTNGPVRIGACTLMSELEADPVVRTTAPLLAEAVGRIACPQIRNRATIGGNLCNASPAADAAVPATVPDAVLEVASLGPSGVTDRQVPITDFFRGPGSTSLAPGEILTCIRFNPLPTGWYSAWDKFGTRPAMEIAVASVGVVLGCDDGVVTHARVGYGSVAPIPMRGREAEAELVGHRLTDAAIDKCAAVAGMETSPITDVRAGEAYRRRIISVMLTRILADAGRGRQG